MRCPHCDGIRSTIINTDRRPGSEVVVRRRLCLECKKTYKGVKRPGQPEFIDRRKEPRQGIAERQRLAPERRAPDGGRWGVRSKAAPELVAFLKQKEGLE